MSTSALGGLFQIQSGPQVSSPAAVLHKPKHSNETPTAVELDELNWGNRYNGPTSGTQTPFGDPITPASPKTPNELEMSRPPSPKQDEAASPVQTWSNPSMNRWRVLSCCVTYFGNGMNDSAPGPLIPYMETDYGIGYAIVSLIFVGNAVGFIAAAFFTNWFLHKLGRAKTLMLSELILIAANIIIVTTPPFGVVIFAFFLLGFGAAINLALNNVFCANLHPSSVILGAAHGTYGIGGTVGPIIATTLVTHGITWSRFYLVVLGIRILALIFAGYSFWHYEEEAPARLLSALERTASRQNATEENAPTKTQLMKQALNNRVTFISALFIFAYQGAETSVSGWVISFLISYRNGDPAHVGYVTAGFWAGITLGRFTLTHAAPRIGERPFVVALTLGTIAFQFLVWFVPNVIGDAVAVAILGLLIGPVYPCGQTVFARLLPRDVQTTSIAFISSAGSSGGAVAPFLTGLLAQAVGTWVLNPICVGLYVVMVVCWLLLPKVRKRTE